MMLRILAFGALFSGAFGIFLGFSLDQPWMYGTAAIQSIVAFAVLMALAEIVDRLRTIAEKTKQ
ncbi:hypothetical protein [Sulfitobacter sp. SK012]|uniref:hypothetical protein n=1 Tax=Sulfitobacter sp. SK012 TaxID=1389005 RepID=UPI0013B3906C|nr:hypothetical protein [Sulfitobacter sp. SK012]